MIRTLVFALVAATLGVGGLAHAADYGNSPRQYYGNWQKSPQQTYAYRQYYYKPSNDYSGYKHHTVVRTPQDPKHHYYYNPYTKQYWGRCPVDTNGQGQYSLLAEKDRRGKLEEIPESAFPAPGPLPPIPESKDGISLDLPPDDLPPELAGGQ